MKSDDVEKEVVIASFGEFTLTSKRLLYKDGQKEINNKFIVAINASYESNFIKKWLLVPIVIIAASFYLYGMEDIKFIIDDTYLTGEQLVKFFIAFVVAGFLIFYLSGSLHNQHYQINVICSAPFSNIYLSAENDAIKQLVIFEKKLRKIIYPSLPFLKILLLHNFSLY